jgi:hypothetical protein
MWSHAAAVVAVLLCSQSHVVAQLFPNAGCSICPSSAPDVGLPDVVLPAGTAGVLTVEQTCAETEELAQSGAYSQGTCLLLRASGISITCGCQAAGAPVPVPVPVPTRRPVVPPTAPVAAPTEAPVAAPVAAPTETPVAAPVAAPTVAPVAAPTEAPVVAPVAAPTEAPVTAAPTTLNVTATPTATPVATVPPTLPPAPTAVTTLPTQAPVRLNPGNGTVSIRLNSTAGPLSEAATATYLAVCAFFYEQELPSTASNVSCAVLSRRRTESKHSNYLRSLQSQTLLVVDTEVTALFSPSAEVFDLNAALVEAVNANPDAFALYLRTKGEDISDTFFQSVSKVEAFRLGAVPPTAPIAAAPAAAPTVAGPPATAAPTKPDDDDGLSTAAIIGIAVGVSVGVGLFIAIAVFVKGSNPQPASRPVHSVPVASDFPSPQAPPSRTPPTLATSSAYAKEPAPAPVPRVPAATAAAVGVAAVAASTAGSKDPDGNKDGMSVMTGSEMDAFSLDAGNVDQPSSAPGTKKDTVDGMSQSGDEMSSHAMSSLRQNMVSRTVIAPPGKLGIVIDTTLEGPVVHKINPQSPLEGTLFPGDIIVAIDDVDTRAMSASAITALMVRTANLRRKLTVLSEDVTN